MDERSDAEVYAQYSNELVRFATGLVGPTDAQDVVAEAMLRVMTSRIWAHAENRRALMYKAVFYQARAWNRTVSRRRVRDLHALQQYALDLLEVDPEVLRAVWQLSPMQRAVVFLTYWDDLDASSVSSLLGVSTGTVRKHLGRARDRLREVLE